MSHNITLCDRDITIKAGMAKAVNSTNGFRLTELLSMNFLNKCDDPECADCIRHNSAVLEQLVEEDKAMVYSDKGGVWVRKWGTVLSSGTHC